MNLLIFFMHSSFVITITSFSKIPPKIQLATECFDLHNSYMNYTNELLLYFYIILIAILACQEYAEKTKHGNYSSRNSRTIDKIVIQFFSMDLKCITYIVHN